MLKRPHQPSAPACVAVPEATVKPAHLKYPEIHKAMRKTRAAKQGLEKAAHDIAGLCTLRTFGYINQAT